MVHSCFQVRFTASRRHERAPLLSVVVASSVNSADEIVQALRLGAKDYLLKPIADVQTVVDSISRVLNQRELERINLRYHDQLRAANTQLQDNLDELERDHLAGRRVQKRMMPTGLTTPDGFSVQHRILPSLYLSGDFIDYGLLADRYLVFYLADVSGHGASSAFVTVWLLRPTVYYLLHVSRACDSDASYFTFTFDTQVQSLLCTTKDACTIHTPLINDLKHHCHHDHNTNNNQKPSRAQSHLESAYTSTSRADSTIQRFLDTCVPSSLHKRRNLQNL